MGLELAFALAGLGGYNAHGAGFLDATKQLKLKPDLITATSGQIIVLSEWLRGGDLKALLIDSNRARGPLGTLMTAVSGDPGIFRPASAEYWRRWQNWPMSVKDFEAALFPAQEYVPLRTKAYLATICNTLNHAPMGVVFNAYNPSTGEGSLFGNDAARKILTDVTLEIITEEAVAAALWLSLYGFDGLPNGLMDGAYHRSCIVAELQDFATVCVARPLAQGWSDELPTSWFEVQDWQTEMWFSSSYKAEVADMKRINTLIHDGYLKDDAYKHIKLIEIIVDHPAGYFNFFTERSSVYDAAHEQTLAVLPKSLSSKAPRAKGNVTLQSGIETSASEIQDAAKLIVPQAAEAAGRS